MTATGAIPPPGEALAERYARWACAIDPETLPEAVVSTAKRQLLDVVGLCLGARGTDYVAAVLESCEGGGPCTVIGHAAGLTAGDAALVNGTAAHGEDYDDTFEGTPVHPGAVVVPAALAAVERTGGGGRDLLRGVVAGNELACRMALAAPGAMHRAGFHPTAIIGAMGATAAAGVATRLPPEVLSSALGTAGSLASGIIEYLAEGTWTKRLHAGWAARSGLTAARLAEAGFRGPRTVLDGRHGFFHAFTDPDAEVDAGAIDDALGRRYEMAHLATKPFACGTMVQPFIDCALALRAAGTDPDRIESMECDVGEGTVHRLWEPLADKRRPANGYAAKFSVPYGVAVALVDGAAGLEQFTDGRVRDEAVLRLADRVGYRIDPTNEYPANYTGRLRVRFEDGTERSFEQPCLRGGRHAPLGQAEVREKFRANAHFGGWPASRIEALERALDDAFHRDALPLAALLRE